MYRWLGILSLLLALWLVMSLVQRQMGTARPVSSVPDATQTPRPQQVPQQYQKALQEALEQSKRKRDGTGEDGR